MRDARPGGGPAPKPISRRNTAGLPKHSNISAQLAHYNRQQGTSRGHGGAAQVLTPSRPKSPRRDYPSTSFHGPGWQKESPRKVLQDVLSSVGFGGIAHPVRRAHNLGGQMMFPGFGRVSTIRPAAWGEGPGGIPKGPGMPRTNADLARLEAKRALAEAEKEPGPTAAEKVGEGLKKGRAKGVYREQKQLRHEELSRRVESAQEALAKGTGEEAFRAAKRELRGQLPKAEFHGLRSLTSGELDTLRGHIQNHPDLSFFDKTTAWDALRNAHEHGQVPAPHEYRALEKAFGPEFVAREFSPSALAKWRHRAIETANIPRAVMSSFDVSAPGRQGLVGIMRHPVVSGRELGPMVKALGSEDYYRGWRQELEAHPRYEEARKSGLALTDVEHTLANREEPFQSNYAETLTGVGRLFGKEKGSLSFVRGSGRAYNRFLVGQRFGIYNHLTDYAEKHGIELSEKAHKQLASYINSATGRGSLGQFERSAVGLNSIFFSPRLIASRLDFLLPWKYAGLDPFVRRQKLRAAFQTVAAVSTVLYLANRVAGVKVGVDPRSTDFAKIKIGNTRIDIGGGFNQYIRLAAQLSSGQMVDTNTGEIKSGEGWNSLGRFVRAKFSPTTSGLVDLATRSNAVGQPLDAKSEIASKVTPLVLQDAYAVLHQTHNVPAAIGAYGLSATGVGVQSYGPPKPTGKTADDLRTDLAKNVRQYLGRGLTPQVKRALHLRESRENYFKKVLPKRPGRGASDEEKKAYALHRFNAQIDLLVRMGLAPGGARARRAKAWARGQDYHKVNSETSYIGRKYFGGLALSDAAKKIREKGGHFYLSDY